MKYFVTENEVFFIFKIDTIENRWRGGLSWLSQKFVSNKRASFKMRRMAR